MNTTILRGVFILLVFMLTNCNVIFKYKNKESQVGSKYIKELEDKVFNFESIVIKSRFDYLGGGQFFKGISDIRIQKDSFVWVSIRSTLGIEGFRLLIYPDTIWAIDRIGKKAYKSDFKFLNEKTNFDISFNILQSILLGNSPHRDKKIINVTQTSTEHILSQIVSNTKIDHHISNDKNHLTNLIFTDYSVGNRIRKLSILYKDFIYIDSQVLPIKYSLSLDEENNPQKNLKLQIEYSKVINDDKPLKYPFRIPSKYPIISY